MPPERAARVIDALDHLEPTPDGPTVAPSGELSGPRALVLSGPRPLVREVLTVAIDEAAEALGAACTGLLRGTGSAPEVRAGVAELSGLLDILEGIESR